MYIPVYDDKLTTRFIKPPSQPLFKPVRENIELIPGQFLNVEAIVQYGRGLGIVFKPAVGRTIPARIP
jgi:hypothetical protein